jgi:hypothetical protein
VEAFARSVVEDAEVRALLLTQARDGSLPAPMYQMFFHYAYGKPIEQRNPDDQAFMESLLAVVLKHGDTPEVRREVSALIEAHAGGHRLRAVA